jgi:hypothetical protein
MPPSARRISTTPGISALVAIASSTRCRQIGEAAAGINVFLQRLKRIRRVVLRVRPRDHGMVRPQQCITLAIKVVVGHDIKADALCRQPVEEAGIGGEVPQAGPTPVEIGDVSGPHRKERTTLTRIADAAAIAMRVVGRGAVFRVVLGIPRVGAPFGLPRAKRIVDIAALVVAVNLIGEGRGKKNEWRSGDTRRWQDIDRHDVLLAAAAQTHAIDARGHGVGKSSPRNLSPSRNRTDHLHGNGSRHSAGAGSPSSSPPHSNAIREPLALAGSAGCRGARAGRGCGCARCGSPVRNPTTQQFA